MKILMVYTDSGTASIPIDRIIKNEVLIEAYKGEELVGVFPIMSINYAYVSEKKEKKDEQSD